MTFELLLSKKIRALKIPTNTCGCRFKSAKMQLVRTVKQKIHNINIFYHFTAHVIKEF